MISQQRLKSIFVLLFCLLIAGCGPGQLFGPTLTPTPTMTLTPSATSTSTPTLTPSPTFTLTPVPTPNVCKLREAAFHRDIGLGFPRYTMRMASTGTVKAKVIFVDFSDAPASETPEEAFARISPGAPDFFKAVSYGRLDLEMEPYLVWLRMSKPSGDYDFERGFSFDTHRAYIQEAISLANANVDFSDAQAVYIIANPQARKISFGPAFTPIGYDYGIYADKNTITNGATSGVDISDWGFLWLNHEAGHTLGWVDLYAYQYNTNNYDSMHSFVGGFSLMGYIGGLAPEPLAYERWLVNWLDDGQIICQQMGDATTTLTAIESTGGVKAVMIPVSQTSAVIVESRRPLGYDSGLVKSGALVYSIDTSISTGEGPIKIFPASKIDPYRYQSPLAADESVTVGNVTVTVVSATADGDTVQVTVTQ